MRERGRGGTLEEESESLVQWNLLPSRPCVRDIIKHGFALGVVSKQQYTGALEGDQVAADEIKSLERDEAKVFFERQVVLDACLAE